ncbi:hypothetical protein NA56DRAFT_753937 [Hyaloscypha hepaticicola]|uniref:Uncharacterized protein n=1 Tax=Hyaloscypha hepaticicola TaxID=2082293 RepID=A0A2J6PMZ4_9HELO|nr:hypothetical protein NA56DRAFT_753937 [Hyaloscypha hepaticicola]
MQYANHEQCHEILRSRLWKAPSRVLRRTNKLAFLLHRGCVRVRFSSNVLDDISICDAASRFPTANISYHETASCITSNQCLQADDSQQSVERTEAWSRLITNRFRLFGKIPFLQHTYPSFLGSQNYTTSSGSVLEQSNAYLYGVMIKIVDPGSVGRSDGRLVVELSHAHTTSGKQVNIRSMLTSQSDRHRQRSLKTRPSFQVTATD